PCDFHNVSEGMPDMNSNGNNRRAGRVTQMSICLARIAAAALILMSTFALAWATSRNNDSKTAIDVKAPQPRLLHTKPSSMARRHGSHPKHHAVKQGAKPHGHGQQNAQRGVSQGRNLMGARHGGRLQSDTSPTPTPEETPTPTPELTPKSGPILTTPVSIYGD